MTSLFVDPAASWTAAANSAPVSSTLRIDLGLPSIAASGTSYITVTTSSSGVEGWVDSGSGSIGSTGTTQLPAGAHSVTAYADFAGTVAENNEVDNGSSTSFTILTPPNLGVTSASVGTTNSISTTTFVVNLANTGATATGSFTTTLFVDPASGWTPAANSTPSNLLEIDLGLPSGIAASGSVVVTATTSSAGIVATVSSGTVVTNSVGTLQIPAGTHSVTTFSDFTNAVAEATETNNYASTSFTVVGAPDLVVSGIAASAASSSASTSVVITVTNQGGQAAAASTVRVFIDPLTTLGTPDAGVSPSSLVQLDVSTASITAGSRRVLNTTTSAVGVGPHTVWGVADYNNVVDEDTEANNVASNSFVVSGGTVLLKALTGGSATARVGTQTQFTMTVQMEAGTTPVDAVEVHLTFDPTALQVIDPTTGAAATTVAVGDLGALSNSADNTNGRIDYVWVTTGSAISGTKVIASIPFSTTASAPSGGSTTVSFGFAPDRRTDVQRSIAGGSTSVLQRADSATVRIGSNSVVVRLGFPSQRGAGTSSTRFVVTPTIALLEPDTATIVTSTTSLTDPTGVFTVTGLVGGQYDISVTVTSALSLLWENASVAGPTILNATAQSMRYGDADNNNTVNISDFNLWLAKLFAACGGTAPAYSDSVDFNADCVVNITDFIMWKENIFRSGPIVVTAAPASALAMPAADTNRTIAPVRLSIPTVPGPIHVGEIFYLPVQIDAAATTFDAAELHLDFDRSVLRVVDPASGAEAASILAAELGTALGNKADNTLGKIDFAWATFGAPASGSKVIARIPFKAIGPSAGTPIRFAFGPDRQTDIQSVRIGSVLGESAGASVRVSPRTTASVPMQIGWTLVALPQSGSGPYTAASLLGELAAQGIDAAQVARWENGSWHSYIRNFPAGDFAVDPGRGYFVKASQPGIWSVAIDPPAAALGSTASVSIHTGWTALAPSQPGSEIYTASSLLDEMAAQGLAVGQIGRWENGRWETYVRGFPVNDFSIELGRGYVVNTTNEGVWTPRTGATP